MATVALSLLLLVNAGCKKVESIYGFHAYNIVSSAMEKTILVGDTILCDQRAYQSKVPARGDVVVFSHKGSTLVKRLIGLPGDRVEEKDGVVLVNGVPLTEPYAQQDGPTSPEMDMFGPAIVAPATVFLLGDNRHHSLDSRFQDFGEVKLSEIQGKVVSVLQSEHGQGGRKIQ